MEDLALRQLADLHAATFAVGEDDLGIDQENLLRQVLPDILGDLVLLLLEAVEPPQAAALRFDHTDIESRDAAEQLQGGKADVQRLHVAGGEIGGLHRERPELHRLFSFLMEAQEKLADIEQAHRQFLGAREVEERAVFVAEHQAATRRGKDDVGPLPNGRQKQREVPEPHLPGAPEVADSEARNAAAALGGNEDRKAVRLQESHGGLSHIHLVRIREAAVEVSDPRMTDGFARCRTGTEPLSKSRGFVFG